MITLIGLRCKHSNVLSQEVLIVPFPLGNLEIIIYPELVEGCSFEEIACFKK